MTTTEQIENAKAALGFHPDSDTNIADEISRIRDEGRGHFHTVTKQLDVIAELRRQTATYKEDQRVSSEAYNFLHGQYRDLRDACHKTVVFMNSVDLQDTEIVSNGILVDVRILLRQVLNRTMELPKQ